MPELIVCLDEDSKKLNHVKEIIEKKQWDKVFIVAEKKGDAKGSYIIVEQNDTIEQTAEKIKKALDGKLSEFEANVNLVCGTGKLHMAVLMALLNLGVGIRLVIATKEGVKIV